jgi:hypothetical protein
MKKLMRAISVFCFTLSMGTVFAADRLELDKANIQGASELPKVLYIVPWKKAEMGDRPIKVNRMVDEVLSPVDRDVLKRQIKFHEQSQVQSPE